MSCEVEWQCRLYWNHTYHNKVYKIKIKIKINNEYKNEYNNINEYNNK